MKPIGIQYIMFHIQAAFLINECGKCFDNRILKNKTGFRIEGLTSDLLSSIDANGFVRPRSGDDPLNSDMFRCPPIDWDTTELDRDERLLIHWIMRMKSRKETVELIYDYRKMDFAQVKDGEEITGLDIIMEYSDKEVIILANSLTRNLFNLGIKTLGMNGKIRDKESIKKDICELIDRSFEH